MKFSLSFSTTKKKKNTEQVDVAEPQEAKVIHEALDFETKYGEIVRRVFEEENAKYANLTATPSINTNSIEKPIAAAGGRVSLYEGYRNMLPNDNSPVPTDFNFKLLGLMKDLSIWNPHFSMAVENIVTLGNTDYEIDFGDSFTDRQAIKVRQYLNERVNTWYEFSNGEESLDNDLLAQICNYGTISAEAVIQKNMRGIQNIVRVDPEFIRFAYDQKKNIHIPLQEIGGFGLDNKKESKYPGYIQLNPNTYFYIARMRMGEMPYAIPPFLSAIESVFIENDMVKNFQNMMKRLGMMGFLSVLINSPQPLPGETDAQYQQRLVNYLDRMRAPVEKGFSRGVVIGYKDTHEFEVHAPMNPAAAEQAMNMIQSLIFTALKQDPNMHGKNYSVTETFGRVLLEKMTLQIANWQKVLATFKASIFKLELRLAGFPVNHLLVNYEPAATADEKRKHEIGTLQRTNLTMDYNQGLISQEQYAQALGYDKPFQPEPRETDALKVASMKIKAGVKDEPPVN